MGVAVEISLISQLILFVRWLVIFLLIELSFAGAPQRGIYTFLKVPECSMYMLSQPLVGLQIYIYSNFR